MSTIEEVLAQARETLADYQRANAGGYGAGNHASLARALRVLLDATEPAEDEREALTTLISATTYQAAWGECVRAADAILAAGYSKGPRPITDEMVEAAARVMFDAPAGMTGDYTWAEMVGEDPSRADLWRADARAALEAAEEARR